eukprot:TRINITY_DN22819_c0_g1_i2.p3 TRINITY_DN22819_c0_g1~~TRINITY_DN22819_c0_g1_i2.p3  ORF type:complete len:106 (-),score=23.14 TRINITY_DN22819_c0_g1_i2:84-401(-)
MIRRPPRSTQGVSSAASDVYKRQMISRISKFVGARALRFPARTMATEINKIYDSPEAAFHDLKDGANISMGGFGLVGVPENSILCLLYTSPSPRDLSTSRMPSSA